MIRRCRTRDQRHAAAARDRATLLPFLDLFPRAIGEVAHSFGVSSCAIRLAFYQSGSAAGSRSGHRFTDDLGHCENIVAINFKAWQSIVGRSSPDVGNAAGIGKRDFGGELVVLADEQNRQLPDGGHIQAFVERAVVDRAVTKKCHGNATRFHQLRTVAAAARLQNTWTDDAAGPHHADLRREQVHRAAASPRASGCATEQFSHQFSWRHPLGQRMPMPTMRAEDRIVVCEMRTNSRRNSFLANIGVARAEDQPALMAAREFLFRLSDDLHRPIKRKDGNGEWGIGSGGCHRWLLRSLQFSNQ